MRPAIGCAIALALGLGGCTVGPDYRPPESNVPAAWTEPVTTTSGATSRPASIDHWWTSFDDPLLTRLIEQSAGSNPDARIAQVRVREARAILQGTEDDFGPLADGSAAYSRQRISQNQPIIGSIPVPPGFPYENDVYQVGFDASWEIDLFGGKRRAREAAGANLSAVEDRREALLVSLSAEVARDYVRLRALQKRLAITRDDLELQQQALQIARVRFDAGMTNELDVTRASALLAQTRSRIPFLEQEQSLTMHALAVLAGRPPGDLVAALSQPASFPAHAPGVPVGLPSDLLRRRPDVRAAERDLAAATARIGAETAELFPKFSLTGTLGLQSIDLGSLLDSQSRYFTLGPSFQWRWLDSGRIRGRIKATDARQAQALATYDKTVLGALRDVEDALAAYGKQQKRHSSIADEVEQDRRSVETANALYEQGRIAFLDVLDAQRSLDAARDQLVQSEQAQISDLIALYKALGGGWQSLARIPASRPAPKVRSHESPEPGGR